MNAGVYLILCTSNGDRYIGSSKDIATRKHNHWYNLRTGKSHNVHMQNAWNKYGPDSFTFEVLEIVTDVSSLTGREQYWIDLIRPEFNKAKTATSGFTALGHSEETRLKLANIQRSRMQSSVLRQRLRDAATEQNRTKGNGSKGKPVSEERKHKLREANKRQFSTPESRTRHSQIMKSVMTPDVGEKIRQSKLGLKATDETKQQMATSQRKRWESYSPEERAARTATTSASVSAAKAKHYHGFIAPDGTIYRDVYNMRAFCAKHGLSDAHMAQVSRGKRNHHRGWVRLPDEL